MAAAALFDAVAPNLSVRAMSPFVARKLRDLARVGH